jgi:copper resistance protein B
MRPLVLAIGLTLGATTPATAMEAMTFHMARAEIDATQSNDADIVNWDGEAWIGGDRNKLWVKTEGVVADGETEDAEVQALWSRNVADFWDLQAGVRVDLEIETRTYLALGIQGLAPYQFETEATAFVSDEGDLSARLRQSFDMLFTQRLALEPHIEANVYARDDARRQLGAGLADVGTGLQLRYEITRKFAPYVDLVHERALGETAARRRAAGYETGETTLRAGVRVWF